ncbi:MAG: hypothetical protein JWM89_2204 [Acidimicrobiales bacterium]|nr:hypothetical protein [Acidimicrobiales bacterium]
MAPRRGIDPVRLARDLEDVVGAGHVGAGHDGAVGAVDDLRARHREPHRRYHTEEHVAEVLREVDRLGRTLDTREQLAIRLAAAFHDAIYDPAASNGESEAASAELAVRTLRGLDHGADEDLVSEVDRLIRLTVGHEVAPDDRAGAVLVDADLWVLSAAEERYDRYVRDVRAEYAHVADDLWRVGRGAVLQRFLVGIAGLYGAGEAEDQAERRARAALNLRRELASLGG